MSPEVVFGVYLLGLAIWVCVCGFLREDLVAMLGLFWPVYVPILVLYGIGRGVGKLFGR
jgi:hypothetical protein